MDFDQDRYVRRTDIQQVCLNGHQITNRYNSDPPSRKAFCPKCGAKTINSCQNCHNPINGCAFLYDTGYDTIDYIIPEPVPEFCAHCGKPFPWTPHHPKKQISSENEKAAIVRKRPTCPKSLKEALWRQYFGEEYHGECYVCHAKIALTNFEVGHNEPFKEGGEWTISNLRPLCRTCNRSMGTETVENFKKKHFK